MAFDRVTKMLASVTEIGCNVAGALALAASLADRIELAISRNDKATIATRTNTRKPDIR
jgi:hypothetical protein